MRRKNLPKIDLRASRRGTVIVRKIEVQDAPVKRPMHDRTLLLRGVRGSEILPQAERYFGQHQARVANPAVGHVVVAGIVGDVAHPTTLRLSADPVGFLGFNLRGSRGWYLLRANEGLLAVIIPGLIDPQFAPRE